MPQPTAATRVKVRKGWMDEGRTGTQLGPPIFVQQFWTPILWDDDEDPDFFKTAGLEVEHPGVAVCVK